MIKLKSKNCIVLYPSLTIQPCIYKLSTVQQKKSDCNRKCEESGWGV